MTKTDLFFYGGDLLGFWIFRSFSFPTKKIKKKRKEKEGSLVEHHTRLTGCRGVFFFFTTTTTTRRLHPRAHTQRESRVIGAVRACRKERFKTPEKRPLHQEESAFSYIFQQTCPTMLGTTRIDLKRRRNWCC